VASGDDDTHTVTVVAGVSARPAYDTRRPGPACGSMEG
jgi:hypothetical protein